MGRLFNPLEHHGNKAVNSTHPNRDFWACYIGLKSARQLCFKYNWTWNGIRKHQIVCNGRKLDVIPPLTVKLHFLVTVVLALELLELYSKIEKNIFKPTRRSSDFPSIFWMNLLHTHTHTQKKSKKHMM